MMRQIPVTPTPDGIAASVKMAKTRGLPPVESWDPPFMGDIDIRITRNGTWIHEGGEIRREGLVRLFSSILRKDGAEYFLVTPVEKVRIVVEDAPFVAVDVDPEGQGADQILRFVTNVGDAVSAGPEHPIRVEIGADGAPAPYVVVRRNLEASIDRKTFYRLVDLGVHHAGWFGLWSGGVFFRILPSDQLEG